jgi:hypothetical protein
MTERPLTHEVYAPSTTFQTRIYGRVWCYRGGAIAFGL